jgi:pimeloyl-ACP methyl ester carboxylesterase
VTGTGCENEFRFLYEEAARLGVSVPASLPRRVAIELSESGVLSAIRWGNAAPEVLTLHGAALNAHSWDTVLLALGRPAIAVDLPGHGWSSWRSDADYSPERFAAAVSEAVAAWCTSPVTLVGHSRGGLSAILAAERLGPSVSSVIIVDNTPGHRPRRHHQQRLGEFHGPASFASRDEVVDHALRSGLGQSRESLVRGVYFNTRVRDDGRVVFAHHLASLPLRPFSADEAARTWAALGSLTAPVTLVVGTRGILTPDELDEFRTHAPAATVIELNAGHNVHRDAPLQLAAVIAGAFIGE